MTVTATAAAEREQIKAPFRQTGGIWSGWSSSWPAASIGVGIFIAVAALWHFSAEYRWVSPLLLAPPADVFATLGEMIGNGSLWPNFYATAYVTLAGFLVAVVAAFFFAVIFVFAEPVQKAITPYLIVIQTFPKVAIAPLIIAGLGYGTAPKVVLAALLAFFPVLVNTMAGLTTVSEDQINLFRSVRAGRWRTLLKLRVPNSVSYILPSLNTAAVLALIGTVVAEFVSARQGLGFAIQASTQIGSVSTTYAILIVLGCFGVVIWLLIAMLRKALARFMI